MYVMKLSTIPRKALWGNTKLRDYFQYDYPEGIGQSWSFSAQEANSNFVVNGEYKGKSLSELWNEYPNLFESRYRHFPFIIGLVAPEDSLSIQVHPDEEYAKAHQLPSGKNEAWYFMDADTDADLIYGLNANNLDELKAYIQDDAWEKLVKRIPVKSGDFVYVPAGMLHAMQKGVVAYEVQEATDVTYRLYDYNRIDKDGNKRKLDIQESLDCIKYDIQSQDLKYQYLEGEGYKETCFINNESFKIVKLDIEKKTVYHFDRYQLLTVIEGKCEINQIQLTKGDSVFVPKGLRKINIDGKVQIMITSEGDKE